MNKIKEFFKEIPSSVRGAKARLPFHSRKQWAAFFLLSLVLVSVLVIILRVEDSCTVLEKFEKTDVTGTQYLPFGRKLFKYSPDGVSCVDGKGEVLWNSTYSMNSPIVDVCGTTVAVGDQQGTSVYIFNEDGQMGTFETLLPIQKVKVAEQGVVAAILEDGDVTWINFYDTQGGEIAKMRTTLKESGYPVDMALSPDGLKIMVSFLYADKGIMKTRVAFYNFDAVGQAEQNNQVNVVAYNNAVAPSVFFVDSRSAVALRSDGFSVYRGSEIPEEKVSVSFEDEVLSTFHEEGKLGFIFKSDKEGYKYKMMVYGLNGRCSMKKYFNLDYRQTKMSEGNIILYNEKEFQVFSSRGRKRVDITYQKAIEDVVSVPGLGKYMVICSESTDLIRVK